MWKTFGIFLVLCFVLICAFGEEKCSLLETEEGLINIKPLCGEVHHPFPSFVYSDITLTFCQNLEKEDECNDGREHDPITPFKEYYHTHGQEFCCYHGGIDKCSFGDYDPKTKTSILYYPGNGHKEHGFMGGRDVVYTIHCNSSYTKRAKVDCEEGLQEESIKCKVETIHGCPKESPFNLKCNICMETYRNLATYMSEEEKEKYISMVQKNYCPTQIDPNCFKEAENEIPMLFDKMGDKEFEICTALGLCDY